MSILVGSHTRLLVQGITGKEGSFQTRRCIEYGTKVVAAADAVLEAAYAEVPVIICITEGVPTMDMVRVRRFLKGSDLTVIGPNCPGAITPGEARVGIMPGNVFSKGKVGVISRSGTLVYETVAQLTDRGVGQSTCVGVGGDPVVGTTQVEALRMFNDRRRGRAAVGGVHRERDEEAGGRIHRRCDGAAWSEDGPCGSDHCRRGGNGCGEEGGAEGGGRDDRRFARGDRGGDGGGGREVRGKR